MKNVSKWVIRRATNQQHCCEVLFATKVDDSCSENADALADESKQPESDNSSSLPSGSSSWTYGISTTYLKDYFNSLFSNSQSLSSMKGLPKKLKPDLQQRFGLQHPHQVISREALRSRTEALVDKLKSSKSTTSGLFRTRELCQHLIAHPECSCVAWQSGAVRVLLRMRQKTIDRDLINLIAQCLALLGLVNPVNGPGIRLLSIDGGGTRGLMALEILDALQALCPEREIYSLFDYIVGVSTGALIAALIGGLHMSVGECKRVYREASTKLFDQKRLAGSLGLIRSHSYYDSNQWTASLRELFGEIALLDTTTHENHIVGSHRNFYPKLGIVSCVVQPRLEPFIFRNYYYHPDNQSTYLGSGAHKIWEALRASAAAPGYFAEFKLGSYVHQDGGVLANNPTGMGLHECRLLWPETPLHCVLSIGNGRIAHLPQESGSEPQFSSAIEKLYHAVASATDTEKVHVLVNDLLSSGVYYRANPYMTRAYGLDETEPSVLDQMTTDAKIYVRKNEDKLKTVARRLLQPNNLIQTLKDKWNRKLLLYGFT